MFPGEVREHALRKERPIPPPVSVLSSQGPPANVMSLIARFEGLKNDRDAVTVGNQTQECHGYSESPPLTPKASACVARDTPEKVGATVMVTPIKDSQSPAMWQGSENEILLDVKQTPPEKALLCTLRTKPLSFKPLTVGVGPTLRTVSRARQNKQYCASQTTCTEQGPKVETPVYAAQKPEGPPWRSKPKQLTMPDGPSLRTTLRATQRRKRSQQSPELTASFVDDSPSQYHIWHKGRLVEPSVRLFDRQLLCPAEGFVEHMLTASRGNLSTRTVQRWLLFQSKVIMARSLRHATALAETRALLDGSGEDAACASERRWHDTLEA